MATVLLIDDDPEFLAFGVAQLGSRGHRVIPLAGAAEALRLNEEVDFIIADVVMDPVDGEHFLEEMGKRDRAKSVPILMVSARKDLVASVRMIAKGALDLARKPIDWDRVDTLVRDAALKRRAEGAAETRQDAPAAAPADQSAGRPKVLIVEDSSTQRALWRLTLSDKHAHTRIVPDGIEALKAIASENFHLLITDLELGDINGWQVADAARRRNAKLPVIVISSQVQTGRPPAVDLPGERGQVYCFHKADRADALLKAGRVLGLPPVP